MALTYISSQEYAYLADFQSILSYTAPTGADLLILHYIRGNAVERLGANPTYNGVSFTTAVAQVGVGAAVDSTCEVFYLLNPPAGAHNLVIYQGVYPDGGTVQYIHAVVVAVAAPLNYTIALDDSDGIVSSGAGPSITATVSSGGAFLFNRLSHDAGTLETVTSDQTYISRADYGTYCGSWAYAEAASAGNVTFNWANVSTDDWVNTIVAFREVPPPSYSLSILQDD